MRQKQWIWLIVAVLLFAGTGAVSVWTNSRARSVSADRTLENAMMSGFSRAAKELSFPAEPFVARVDIEGTIAASSSGIGGCDPEPIKEYIDQLMDCEENVGILLYINSGGGTISASDDIYLKLMDYKEETGRPVYAFFEDSACSGAYYIAMAADEIWANRNSICVNIGVYISAYNLSGLFEKYGIEEVLIRSSENKAIGSVGQPWTEEQRAIYQSIVDLYYRQFLDVVAAGRGMTAQQVKALDDGREMLAPQALQAGFVDGLGRYEEYRDQMLGYFGEDVILYEQEPSELDTFMQILRSIYGELRAQAPRSDGELLKQFVDEQDGIVVMAYAG